MLLDQNSELQLRATRPKPLVVSILVHFVLIAIVAFNPDWFEGKHRRVIRIAGEDFDLSQLELRQLTLPPRFPRALPAPQPPQQAALHLHRLRPLQCPIASFALTTSLRKAHGRTVHLVHLEERRGNSGMVVRMAARRPVRPRMPWRLSERWKPSARSRLNRRSRLSKSRPTPQTERCP